MLDKKYDHLMVEKDKYENWKNKGYFTSDDMSKEPFCIVIPPPNVTGKLHLGHAWDTSIQDMIIRYKKMCGFDAVWVPGMDHAGIATQAKIDKKLIREISKETKYDNIIKMAIYSYDKEGFPDDIDEKTKHICAIIKDAHNLDSFRLFVNYPYVDTRITSYPNNLVYEKFTSFKTISPKMSENSADSALVVLSNMYSFNYRYSYYLLKQNNYIDKMFDSLTFDNKEIESFFGQLVVVLKNYVDKRIGA